MGLGGLSVGLATGINYGEIIESLIAIEQRPIEQLQEKITLNEIKEEAYSELNTLALNARLSMFELSLGSTFESKTTTSSDETVLTASADSTASVGTHQLRVTQLATAAVTLSSGVQDSESTSIGSGTMSFELGGRRLDKGTDLDELNDGAGIDRGVIRITNSGGTTETFDMGSAVTVQDALDILNSNTMGLDFQTNRSIDQSSDAREVNGYSIDVINNGTNSVTLSDLGTTNTLSDLGFKTSSAKSIDANSTSSAAEQIYYITESSSLSQINDGFGIQTNSSGTNDVRFYVENTITGAVKSIEVDFSDSENVGDVIDALNTAISNAQMNAHSQVTLSSDGVSLEFTGVVSDFTNINGSKAGSDLGLNKIELVGGVYKGEALMAEMNGSLIRNLNGGNGIRNLETGAFEISSRRGDSYLINLDQTVSVQDIMRIIEEAEATGAANSITLGGTANMSFAANSGIITDTDFSTNGFEEDRLIGSTITINTGGNDYTATINSFDSDAGTFTLTSDNITNSVADIMTDGYTISYSTLSDISVAITDGGNGLELTDASTGDETFRVDDLNGDVAEQLQIESTITSAAVLFNPSNLTDDPNGSARTSTAFLSRDSLPNGISKDQMIGRSIEHTWSSRTSNSSGSGETTKESARIIAFEEAPDDLYVSDVDASSSSNLGITTADTATHDAGNEDTIVDDTNLNAALNDNLDEDLMVGATYTIYTTNGKFSSTIIDYDSDNNSVTLDDDVIFTELTNVGGGGNEDATLQSLGFTIEYNHKLSLEYDATPTHLTNAALTYNAGTRELTDSVNLDPNSTTIDTDRLEGATITFYDTATNTESTSVIASYNSGTDTITLLPDDPTNNLNDDITNNGVTQADFQGDGYYITYTPIQAAKGGSINFLSNFSDNPDHIEIVGVGSNETIVGGNLENRILSSFTRLDDLNGGQGITRGEFSIDNGDSSTVIDLDSDSIQTIQDVIDEIMGNIASVEVEINDRGDGLRIFDTSSSQTSAITITDVDGSGTAASLNLLNEQFDRFQVSVTSNTDFYSVSGTAANQAGDIFEVNEFSGFSKAQMIGSKISYYDTSLGGELVHAFITDYVDAAGATTITVAGQVTEDGADRSFTYSPDGETISLHLKDHQNDFERFGEITGVGSSGSGVYTLAIDTATVEDYSNYEVEQLVGTMVTLTSPLNGSTQDVNDALGITAMITNYDSGTDTITIQTDDANISNMTNLPALSDPLVLSISKDNAPRNHVQGGGITVADSFLASVTDSGFISITAEVNEGGSATTIISDQFANLDPSNVVGALVTIASHTADDTENGNIAIVTGYNSLTNAITIDTFYDPATGTADAVTLDSTDEVYLTFESEFEDAVIRSEAPTTITVADTEITTLTNPKYLQVDITTAGVTSEDELIGATITFDDATTTAALQGESRTIVDIIHDYNGNQGDTVLVLDRALTTNPTGGAGNDTFDIIYEDIQATIGEVDFSTGVITTRDKMQSSMGDRAFNIHPVIDGTYQKDIDIFATDTLEDIADKINAADVGVDASVINDGSSSNPYRLSLISSNTGELGAVNVGTTIQNFGLNVATQAQDAKVILGEASGSSSVLSGSTNILTDAISGVTLNLVSASDDPITLTVDYDREGITEQVTTVVDEINLLLEAANSLIALETEVEITNEDGTTSTETQKGVLFGDIATRSMINEIKFLLTSIVENVPSGSIDSYSEIGIELDSSGDIFEFDDSILSSVLNSNFDQVKDLFTYTPNLLDTATVTTTSNFLQSGYDINNIRNGITSSSGFSETGNGSNGAKFLAGDSTNYITYTLGEVKDLYGFRFHHDIPEDLSARYNVATADAGGAVLAVSGTVSTLTDATNLDSNVELLEDQLLGATITINDNTFNGTKSALITAYDETTGEITLDADLATAGPDPTVGGYTITTTSGDNLDFTYKPIVEYLDPDTGEYEIYQSFSQIGDGTFSVVFPGGIKSESIRVSYEDNNGDSEDFTKNGYYVRLMEFEVLEAQGLASQFTRTFDGFTNSVTGSLQYATSSLTSTNDVYTSQIERLGESILNKQTLLIRQFQNLELVVSNLNSQSSFFQSQVSSLPTAFSYRGNNG